MDVSSKLSDLVGELDYTQQKKKRLVVLFGIYISQCFLNMYVFGIIINIKEFSIVKWTVQHNPSITVDFISILRAVGSKPKVTLKTR